MVADDQSEISCSIRQRTLLRQLSSRPAVTLPAAGRLCPLASTNLYCLVNRGTRVNNLLKERPRIESATFQSQSTTTRPHIDVIPEIKWWTV